MEKLEAIQGTQQNKEASAEKRDFEGFRRMFKTTLVERDIINDFSLRKVLSEALQGKTDFENHEKEVYDKIKDLLEFSPSPDEAMNRAPKTKAA